MSRTRYWWNPETKELEDISSAPPPPDKSSRYISDAHYDGLRATDGTDISSRTKHREYMKLHGLTTIDDYTETWKKAAEQREKFAKGDFDHAARREQLARSMNDPGFRRQMLERARHDAAQAPKWED